MVQDLAAKASTKQATLDDLPDCTDDVPFYVEIVLMQGDAEVVGTTSDPYRIDLVAGELFTEEDPAMELVPGDYVLDHFAVYNESGTLIWIAPKMGGALADWVENPLPLDISLGAGVKKYVDVPVLCFDNRDVNEYGYTFFELDATPVYEYCFFANYCDPSGRHWPARYSVDISIDGDMVYSGVINTTGTNNDGDFYADPLCFDLPILPGFDVDEDYIHYSVTLLDWDGVYDAAPMDPIEGDLSAADIMANFDGTDVVDYEHLRFGCDDNGGGEQPPMDDDGDGVINGVDQCPGTLPGVEVYQTGENAGCPIEVVVDCTIEDPNMGCSVVYVSGDDGWIEVTQPDGFPQPLFLNLLGDTASNYASVSAFVDGTSNAVIQISMDAGWDLDAYVVEVSDDNDGTVDFCSADANVPAPTGDDPDATVIDSESTYSYPFYIRVKANVCPM
ncbi:MAG: hypothetical protein WBL21_01355 [Salinimicrobium sp.]